MYKSNDLKNEEKNYVRLREQNDFSRYDLNLKKICSIKSRIYFVVFWTLTPFSAGG
jgi:hypothetical protein